MPTCKYCLEEVKAGAKKCPHCQSKIGGAGNDDSDNVVYILDRGLVRFGKFIAAVLGAFLIIGTYIYGLELKDSIKKTSEAEIEVKRALLSIEQERNSLAAKASDVAKAIARVEQLEREIVRHRDETQKNADEVKNIIAEMRRQREIALQIVVELRGTVLNPTEEAVASAKREERGIQRDRGKLWKIGSTLRYRFLDGDDAKKAIVRAAISEWGSHINLKLMESASADSEIRISFGQSGSWSFVGTDALGVPLDQPTINYGTLGDLPVINRAMQIALHEFGHALGLEHEFKNPSVSNLFNVGVLEDYFVRNFGWTKEQIAANFLAKAEYPGSRAYDPESVMSYPMPASLFMDPRNEPRPSLQLSESDKRYIETLYPRS